jgi:hypothetical protein
MQDLQQPNDAHFTAPGACLLGPLCLPCSVPWQALPQSLTALITIALQSYDRIAKSRPSRDRDTLELTYVSSHDQ